MLPGDVRAADRLRDRAATESAQSRDVRLDHHSAAVHDRLQVRDQDTDDPFPLLHCVHGEFVVGSQCVSSPENVDRIPEQKGLEEGRQKGQSRQLET